MKSLQRFIELVTGAKQGEVARTLSIFLALILLFTSYYLVKPLRSSVLYREFDPTILRFLFLAIPFISLFVTRVFNWFYNFVPKFRLVLLTYVAMMVSKVLFMLLLPQGGKVLTLVFYFWTTVYFLLVSSILWGVASTIFNSEAGERVFPFFSLGAMLGSLVGSVASQQLAASPFKAQTLLVSALTMGAVVACIAFALRHTPNYVDLPPEHKPGTRGSGHSLWKDLGAIWKQRYVRSIAIMVFALAFVNTIVEFRSQKDIDSHLAKEAYLNHYGPLNTWLCKSQSCKNGVHGQGFATIRDLRKTDDKQREQALAQWLKAQGAPFDASEQFKAYDKYRDDLDGRTQGYLASINSWINLFGMFLLLFVARPMFHRLGMRQVLVQLPLCLLGVGLLLFFPIGLWALGAVVVVVGTLNYSLNKTAKELLYTQADDEARFRFKPLIDGPVMRMGDVWVAALSIVFMDLLRLPGNLTDAGLLIVGLGVTSWWFVSSWEVGGQYQTLKQEEAANSQQLAGH